MRALVAGCGSIGRRHVGNLRRLGLREVVVFDPDPERSSFARKSLGCETVSSLAEGLRRGPQLALVCTPPHLHRPAAEAILRRQVPCFIEKPLAHRAADAAAIVQAAARSGAAAAVGYQLRQAPALRWIRRQTAKGRWGRLLYLRAEIGQYLPDWRPWQDYRRSYTARRAMGGGILLDASHEIDLVRWLGGEVASVTCLARRLSPLEIDVEDTAELTLELRSGALASVHLDMIQRAYRRSAQFVFERGTVRWEYPSSVGVYSARSRKWRALDFASDPDSLYLRELRIFLRGAASGRISDALVSLPDAARTLSVVEAARESNRNGRRVAL